MIFGGEKWIRILGGMRDELVGDELAEEKAEENTHPSDRNGGEKMVKSPVCCGKVMRAFAFDIEGSNLVAFQCMECGRVVVGDGGCVGVMGMG
jgi:hypothetical protein